MPKRHPLVLLAAAAAGVPDALVVYDGDGNLIGWDESAAERYLDENGRVF